MGFARHNLRLLFALRWLAVAGQAGAILVVTQGLAIPLPEQPLWAILCALSFLNALTYWRMEHVPHVGNGELVTQLLLDMAGLFGLLYYTGGATNPFATLFIVQVLIAAVSLPALYTCIIAVIAVVCYTSLMFFNVEMPYFLHHHIGDFFSLHVQGMWLSFLMLVGIVVWFIVRMNAALRQKEHLLAEAEKMAALGTLATNAAHELGTPLATMAVLAENCEEKTAVQLKEQLQRCKAIISRIAELGGVSRAESGEAQSLADFVQELAQSWQILHPSTLLEVEVKNGEARKILSDSGLQQAIRNVLDNAAHASPGWVRLEAGIEAQNIYFMVEDAGLGMSAELREKIGQAGLTTKPEGFGLGLMLTRNVITRLEGNFRITDRDAQGTRVQMRIPLRRLAV